MILQICTNSLGIIVKRRQYVIRRTRQRLFITAFFSDCTTTPFVRNAMGDPVYDIKLLQAYVDWRNAPLANYDDIVEIVYDVTYE